MFEVELNQFRVGGKGLWAASEAITACLKELFINAQTGFNQDYFIKYLDILAFPVFSWNRGEKVDVI